MATTSTLTTFDTGHMDMVHDIQFDYYGRRVASCSSDRTIKIFDVAGGQPRQLADLIGHEGPVWAVSWGHPKFGTLLASCSYDHRVIVWKETQEAVWTQVCLAKAVPQVPHVAATQVYRSEVHTASVNGVAWAPYELGAVLACASSDGSVSIITHLPDGSWHTDKARPR